MLTRRLSRHITSIFLCILLSSGGAWASTVPSESGGKINADTIYRRIRPEHGNIRNRMMASPFPVELRQQGRQISAQTKNAQILPIYTASGAYYATFRLYKGTNWINGLPRGSYYINGRKFTIS